MRPGEHVADELLDVARRGEREAVHDRLADDVGGQGLAEAGGDETLLGRVGGLRAIRQQRVGAGAACGARGARDREPARRVERERRRRVLGLVVVLGLGDLGLFLLLEDGLRLGTGSGPGSGSGLACGSGARRLDHRLGRGLGLGRRRFGLGAARGGSRPGWAAARRGRPTRRCSPGRRSPPRTRPGRRRRPPDRGGDRRARRSPRRSHSADSCRARRRRARPRTASPARTTPERPGTKVPRPSRGHCGSRAPARPRAGDGHRPRYRGAGRSLRLHRSDPLAAGARSRPARVPPGSAGGSPRGCARGRSLRPDRCSWRLPFMRSLVDRH